ncbi:MAG TPA: hypothetical protein VFS81_23010, partial [Candidatus Binatia bacterium]|nr:hypothetical protein [Candidatus Binatia bacterium]
GAGWNEPDGARPRNGPEHVQHPHQSRKIEYHYSPGHESHAAAKTGPLSQDTTVCGWQSWVEAKK